MEMGLRWRAGIGRRQCRLRFASLPARGVSPSRPESPQ